VLPETTDPDWEFDYIDISSVSLTDGITNKERMRFAASPSRARKPVRKGDILVSTVRTYLKAIAAVEQANTPQVASTGFAVLRANKGTDPRFLYRVVQSNPFVEQVMSQSTGISYPAINPSTLANIEIPLPDLATQRQIADFLDRETERIDLLIEKKQKLVDLLGEKRSSVITQAFTGGGSAQKMVLPLKFCCHVNPSVLPETTDPDWQFDYIDIGSVSLAEGVTSKEHFRFGEAPSRARKLVEADDIVVSTVRTYLKAVAVILPSKIPQVVSTGFAVLRAKKEIHPRYLYRVVQSNPFVDKIVASSTGVSYPAINPSTLANIRIPLPDFSSQCEISDFLDRETSKIDTVKERTLSSVKRLKEYRSALITAAVTGQIDVTTHMKSGITDRRLDAIQEELSA
jgi:type I restriction enzyme, S subunit